MRTHKQQTSPGGLHPPLQLRLTPPDDPGFILERVPVHNIQEVWGILEVRRKSWNAPTVLSGFRLYENSAG